MRIKKISAYLIITATVAFSAGILLHQCSPSPSTIHPWDRDIERVLYTEKDIQIRTRELAKTISKALRSSVQSHKKLPLFVGILTGASFFTTDLVKHIAVPNEIAFIKASSYRNRTMSSGQVDLQAFTLKPEDVEGRTIVIVEDIIDTGLTLDKIVSVLEEMNPAEIKICCLLSKPSRRQVDVKVDYVGFEVDDLFVVGYGLDFAKSYRSLRYIGILHPELYQNTTSQ